jgi:predicted RNA methylase
MVSIIWTSIVGAPWLPTRMKTVNRMLKLAGTGPEDIVYDLGCGDGRTIITAVRKYGARAVGIEIDPLRYIWCQILITILGLRNRIKILYGNFFNKDLSKATLVTCYLLQDTNNILENKLLRELRPDTKVVSNSFTFSFPKMGQDGDARLYLIPNE